MSDEIFSGRPVTHVVFSIYLRIDWHNSLGMVVDWSETRFWVTLVGMSRENKVRGRREFV